MQKPGKRTLVLIGILVCAVVFTSLAIVQWRVGRAIRGAEQELAAEQHLQFVSTPYLPPADSGFEWVSTPAVFNQAAEFQGHLFLAGPSGLFEFDPAGRPVRDFRVGRDIPSSPLVHLAVATLADSRQAELLIATESAGLLAYNGSSFRQIVAQEREARTITAILPTVSGQVLIGTEKRGVLVYDGHRLGPFHESLAGLHITELAGTDTDLWVGTQDRGVAHWHGGTAEWFDERSGLPDTNIYCIAQQGDFTFVGTSDGIAEFDRGKFVRVLASGVFVRSLMPFGKALLAGTMDDGILEIQLTHSNRERSGRVAIGSVNEVRQIFRSKDSLYAVTASGVYVRRGAGTWSRALVPESGLLADRNISALGVDKGNRLWVGYFDRGIDIVDPSRQHARHVEDDHIFCINRILTGKAHNSISVATANGLVLFDAEGSRRQVLGKADGLIADHVTDVAEHGDDLVVATPAGITFLGPTGVRSLYAFHGLVNNHVYTLSPNGRTLLAGTLGGASLLENDNIRTSLTTATSKLKANWITAAAADGTEWWVGTYGAGIAHVNSSGEAEPADGATGDLVINPNAMLSTDRYIAAGSMGRGLYVMQRGAQHWSTVTDGLPSLNVTALVSANGFLYVGTDNGLVRIPEQRLGR